MKLCCHRESLPKSWWFGQHSSPSRQLCSTSQRWHGGTWTCNVVYRRSHCPGQQSGGAKPSICSLSSVPFLIKHFSVSATSDGLLHPCINTGLQQLCFAIPSVHFSLNRPKTFGSEMSPVWVWLLDPPLFFAHLVTLHPEIIWSYSKHIVLCFLIKCI